MRWPRGLREQNRAADAEAAALAREEQRAHAAEMGERLRTARIDQDLGIADVERDTRINRAYIEALEAGHFDALPAPVYARGFMRLYARYLGLDPEVAAAAVPRDLPRPAGLEPLPGLRRTAPAPLWPGLPALNLPVLVAAGATAVVVLLAVFVVPRLGGGAGVPLDNRDGITIAPGNGVASTPDVPGGVAEVPPFDPGTVPNFVGVTRAQAERVMDEAGLVPLVFEQPHEAPAGQVFQQAPDAGEPIEEGDTVTLFVSQGPGG